MRRVTPTFAEIDLRALRANYKRLRRRLPAEVGALCVVKSNAYGHGAPQVAKILQAEGADWFGTGTVDEAIELRKAGIKRPILVLLGLCRDHIDDLFRYRLTPVVYDLETARRLNRHALSLKRRLSVHVKVDTGMTRLGVLPKELPGFCRDLKTMKGIDPQGLLSHLAEAADRPFTARQLKTFREAADLFEREMPRGAVRYYHLSNSQGVVDGLTKGRGAKGVRWLARMGIAQYGAYPAERDRGVLRLDPVMSLKSKIIQLKEVPQGAFVSYHRTFRLKRAGRIAVVPVGYADGYPRALSNRARVLVRGKSAPIAGIVCMDLMMVDVTRIPQARLGDEVVLLGRQGGERISAEELAKLAGTISYEIFCRLSPRVTRVYR